MGGGVAGAGGMGGVRRGEGVCVAGGPAGPP